MISQYYFKVKNTSFQNSTGRFFYTFVNIFASTILTNFGKYCCLGCREESTPETDGDQFLPFSLSDSQMRHLC